MQKFTKYLQPLDHLPDLRGLRYVFQFPTSSKTIRKMAESVDHQQVHDFLVEIARKAGDMIASAQPHVNTSGHKSNSVYPPIQLSLLGTILTN